MSRVVRAALDLFLPHRPLPYPFGKGGAVSRLHYLLPALLAGVLFVWSLFVPMDVQIEIVEGKALVFPQGTKRSPVSSPSNPLLRVIFGMAYYILTIAVLVQFYKKTSKKKTPVRRTAGWVVFLVGLSIGSLLSSLLPTFMPRATILHSFWTILAAGAMALSARPALVPYHPPQVLALRPA